MFPLENPNSFTMISHKSSLKILNLNLEFIQRGIYVYKIYKHINMTRQA